MSEDYILNLVELRRLQSIAKSPRIRSWIANDIKKHENLLDPIGSFAKAVSNPSLMEYRIPYTSWDQYDDKIVIRVLAKGVNDDDWKEDIEESSVKIKFKFKDHQGEKCYLFSLPKLYDRIDEDDYKIVKDPRIPDLVVITLVKASEVDWPSLEVEPDV